MKMSLSWKSAFFAAAFTAVCRADCDDLKSVLSSTLSGDTTLDLPGDVDCPFPTNVVVEEFVVDGGTLTLTGPSTTKFTNLRFTIMDGAGLVFDFDVTEFGPNLGFMLQENYGSQMVDVLSGGFVKFTGELIATGLTNIGSVFYNEVGGSIEFGSNAVFSSVDTNVFRTNFGYVRFYGDATFTDNRYFAIDNDGGTVRIDGDALFVENGYSFDGHSGGAFSNKNGGTAIFHGLATFESNECDESGGAVYNGPGSKMTFYMKADFSSNMSKGIVGGAVDNAGELRFRGAVSATENFALIGGGGFSSRADGTITFDGWTTIQSNSASTGGGMYISDGGIVEFSQPSKVDVSLNSAGQCSQIYVDEDAQLIGYEGEDACDGS